MKILEVENINNVPYAKIRNEGWFIALQNSVRDLTLRYPYADDQERDLIFEQENRCQVNYRHRSKAVRSIVFPKEADYTMFIMRWV